MLSQILGFTFLSNQSPIQIVEKLFFFFHLLDYILSHWKENSAYSSNSKLHWFSPTVQKYICFLKCFKCQITYLSFDLIPIIYQLTHLAFNFHQLNCHIQSFAVPEVISQTKCLTKYWHSRKLIGLQILSFKVLNGPKLHPAARYPSSKQVLGDAELIQTLLPISVLAVATPATTFNSFFQNKR